MVDIIPSTWNVFSNNGNSVQFLLPGHTVQKPRSCILSRVVPSFSGNGPSVPAVRVRIIEGILDTAGKPVATKITADTTIRYDLLANADNVVADVLELGRLLSNAAFVRDLVVSQKLPTTSPWAVAANP